MFSVSLILFVFENKNQFLKNRNHIEPEMVFFVGLFGSCF